MILKQPHIKSVKNTGKQETVARVGASEGDAQGAKCNTAELPADCWLAKQ